MFYSNIEFSGKKNMNFYETEQIGILNKNNSLISYFAVTDTISLTSSS